MIGHRVDFCLFLLIERIFLVFSPPHIKKLPAMLIYPPIVFCVCEREREREREREINYPFFQPNQVCVRVCVVELSNLTLFWFSVLRLGCRVLVTPLLPPPLKFPKRLQTNPVTSESFIYLLPVIKHCYKMPGNLSLQALEIILDDRIVDRFSKPKCIRMYFTIIGTLIICMIWFLLWHYWPPPS